MRIEREFGLDENEISTQPSPVGFERESPPKGDEEAKENDFIFPVGGKRHRPEQNGQDNVCEPSPKKQCGNLH